MRLAIIAIFLLCTSIEATHAQGQCMGSMKVSLAKNVTVLNFGVQSSDSIAMTMPCTAAELMRERMYDSGQALSVTAFDDLAGLRVKMADVNTRLEQQKAALAAAKTKAMRSAILSTLAGLGGTITITGSAAGCIELRVVSCTKLLLAAAAVYLAVDSAATSAADLTKEAVAAAAQIGTLTAAQTELMQRMSAAQATQYKTRYNAAFMELCSSIRRQCLP